MPAVTPPVLAPTSLVPVRRIAAPSFNAPSGPPILPEYFSSTTQRTSITADNGAQITVASAAVLPQVFPFKLLFAWQGATPEVVIALSSAGGNVLNVARGQDGTPQQTQAPGATVDHGVSAEEFNLLMAHLMGGPLAHGGQGVTFSPSTALAPGQYPGQETWTQDTNQRLLWNGSGWASGTPVHTHFSTAQGGTLGIGPGVPVPDVWEAFGHSYLMGAAGTTWQTGRLDAMLRRTLDVEFTAWRNGAVNGARLVIDGRFTGGWVRVMQEVLRTPPVGQNVHGAPYWSDGGAYVLAWGINDLGNVTSGATQTQIRTAFSLALQAVITRCRASVVWEDNYTPVSGTIGQPVYGAGFTLTSGITDFNSGTSMHGATTTTAATITLTIPADYNGEPLFIQFVANAGVAGGTIAFSGTAGVTGTLSTSNYLPSGVGARLPILKRFTNLTAANAGQTIVCTATQVDAGGTVWFDCWGLESDFPPPVIVCNTARVLQAGYSSYPNVFGDPDVAALNQTIQSVVVGYDGLVQIADLDSALAKNPAYVSALDGIHPNEFGAARAANAVLFAVNNLVPTSSAYPVMSTSNSSSVAASLRRPRSAGNYYTADAANNSTVTAAAAGTMYALPYVITEGREIYTSLAFRLAATASGAGTIRWGLYDDIRWSGYPQCLFAESTASGAWSTGTAAGLVTQTVNYILDPGLYWLVFEIVTAGTGVTFESVVGPDRTDIMPTVNGADLTVAPNPIAWMLTGQTTAGFPGTFAAGATLTGNAPKIGMLHA